MTTKPPAITLAHPETDGKSNLEYDCTTENQRGGPDLPLGNSKTQHEAHE